MTAAAAATTTTTLVTAAIGTSTTTKTDNYSNICPFAGNVAIDSYIKKKLSKNQKNF